MARLILFAVLVAAVVVAALTLLAALRPSPAAAAAAAADTTLPRRVDTMPRSFRTISYTLLLVLMVGVTTGWIGGL